MCFFFFNDTATTEIYTLSLHDALPISEIYDYLRLLWARIGRPHCPTCGNAIAAQSAEQIVDQVMALEDGTRFMVLAPRSEEHTSELQSRQYLVCRLLLEKKKT